MSSNAKYVIADISSRVNRQLSFRLGASESIVSSTRGCWRALEPKDHLAADLMVMWFRSLCDSTKGSSLMNLLNFLLLKLQPSMPTKQSMSWVDSILSKLLSKIMSFFVSLFANRLRGVESSQSRSFSLTRSGHSSTSIIETTALVFPVIQNSDHNISRSPGFFIDSSNAFNGFGTQLFKLSLNTLCSSSNSSLSRHYCMNSFVCKSPIFCKMERMNGLPTFEREKSFS